MDTRDAYHSGFNYGFWGGVFCTAMAIAGLLLISHVMGIWDLVRIENL